MADDENDGPHTVARGNGAAGDDGERRSKRESRDRHKPNVRIAGGELCSAFRGCVGGEKVALGEPSPVGLVLEAPH
jgi:hypothetical protein